MEKNNMFKNFAPVLESEVLDEQQMNTLEAGAKCESGCKKACLGGGQNSAKKVTLSPDVNIQSDMPNAYF